MTAKCADPIGLETLTAYWLGELPEASEAMLEEHLFACADCSARFGELAGIAEGVRAAVADGRVSLVVAARFVAAMRRAGLRLREYQLDPGGSVNCTIGTADDAVVSRLRAPLAGVTRLDVVREVGGGAPRQRIDDVPFDAAAGEVFLIPPAAWLKTMPAFTMRVRLIGVDEAGERPIGEYTFNHSPS